MKRTYLISIDSKSKSTFFLEMFENSIPAMLEVLNKKTSSVKIQHIDSDPEKILKLFEKEGIKIGTPITKDTPFTFVPCNSKGTLAPYIIKD